ncbi:hypothetical protein T08_10389 [Trichinella sp. T8]|nr:hypothetical protein T08_10389 [Trichinella sp. T8]
MTINTSLSLTYFSKSSLHNLEILIFYVILVGFCTIALHPSWSLNAVLCYALALRGALYALHVLINVAWLRYQ